MKKPSEFQKIIEQGPKILNNESLCLSFEDRRKLLESLIADKVNNIMNRRVDSMKFCLDAGHGGFDAGAVANGLREKDINLKLALLVGKELTNLGHQVIFTRTTDTIKETTVNENLAHIVKVANGGKADYLISFHENSATPNAKGTEVFCNLKNAKGLKLAKAIQKYNVQYTKEPDRGVKDGTCKDGKGGEPLYVIKHSNMTAVLIETLFISNRLEEKLLANDTWLKGYAGGLAKVIISNVK